MNPIKVNEGIYWLGEKPRVLATINLVPGESVYGERLAKIDQKEYREWIPNRSKPAAAVYKGITDLGLRNGSKVLYLGASSGTTVSHFSDIIGRDGEIYAVEISEEMGMQLVMLAEKRGNVFPLIEDASVPERYDNEVPKCDFLYQDIAQRNQVEIFMRNANIFLKRGGYAAIAVKARSIDVLKPVNVVLDNAKRQLNRRFDVLRSLRLEPFQRDHGFFLLRNR